MQGGLRRVHEAEAPATLPATREAFMAVPGIWMEDFAENRHQSGPAIAAMRQGTPAPFHSSRHRSKISSRRTSHVA
jgi:hypothetical protein